MLAVPWRDPYSDEGWLFEPKWDGVRVLISCDDGTVTLRSRRGNDIGSRYPELLEVTPDRPVVLDGEIVVLDDGAPSFERLQQRSGAFSAAGAAAHPVSCVVFDVLHHGDATSIDQPIERRQEILASLELPEPYAVAQPVVGDGLALWEAVVARDLEGMVAKRRGSRYRPGVRSEDWRKIHHLHTARTVVGGFTPGEGGRAATFGALLIGMWDGPVLRWCGAVGTGFSDAHLVAIREALDQQVRPDCPFAPDPDLPAATWVEPSLVAAVGYRNWTTAGRLRHPRFKGFTDDPVETVTWESEGP